MAHPPADRKAWAALYQQAARLAELENLLFFRTRAGEARQVRVGGERGAGARRVGSTSPRAALLGLRSAQAADFDRVRAALPGHLRGVHRLPPRVRARSAVIKP